MCALQVRVAAEDYHAEFAQKEATIAMLQTDAETQRVQMQQKIDRLASDMAVGPCALAALLTYLTLSFQGKLS